MLPSISNFLNKLTQDKGLNDDENRTKFIDYCNKNIFKIDFENVQEFQNRNEDEIKKLIETVEKNYDEILKNAITQNKYLKYKMKYLSLKKKIKSL